MVVVVKIRSILFECIDHMRTNAYAYPAEKMKTQLLTSLHHETNDTMSDGEWYDGYVENHDDDFNVIAMIENKSKN